MSEFEEIHTPSGLPVMTKALAARIQNVINTLQIAGFSTLQQQKGNPYGVEILHFGSATACCAFALKTSSWWNQVVGMTAEETPLLDKILALYRSYRFACWIRTDTGSFSSELASKMVHNDMQPLSPGTVLYGLPHATPLKLSPGMSLYEASPAEMDLCGELWASGFQLPQDGERDAIIGLRKGWFATPNNHLYIATEDGVPAGVAGLFIHDKIGFLNVGTTLPDFQGRGLHSALCIHRIHEAARMGCELVIGETGAFASRSQNNMERAGMHIAYTHLTWVDRYITP